MTSHSDAASAGHEALGDFTTTPRMLTIAAIAIAIGAAASFVARLLLDLIALATNISFFGRFSFTPVSPAASHLGPWLIAVPVIGGLVIGVMARYGSERIRGHGIPEAIESILINGSRVAPRVAVLKPISAAISIGTGGPFGAEGPIILTGGAMGSLVAQHFHLTSSERKTLLVAGAAAGMSATFATPVAAVLLAVELLLFEWKPRSAIPVACASITAALLRPLFLGNGPLFPVPLHTAHLSALGALACVLSGLAAGGLSWLLTRGVYAAEDAFLRLPVHWMWWPAIGGVAIGLGGLIFPQALGVGYDVIGALLQGDVDVGSIVGILTVKSLIWIIALGSGTSGGVLAPLLMMGGALGGLEARVFPFEGVGYWPLVSMAAILGGTMRVPFTAVVFALELTSDVNMLLPLLIAVSAAYAVTVLTLPRSILTEKVSRRGYHVSREYAVDPLEILSAREVMRGSVVTIEGHANGTLDLSSLIPSTPGQRLYPVVAPDGRLLGTVTRARVAHLIEKGTGLLSVPFATACSSRMVVARPDEPLRVVVRRMAETGLTRFPVVDQGGQFLGMVALIDLLQARRRLLEAESRRDRLLPLAARWPAAFARLRRA